MSTPRKRPHLNLKPTLLTQKKERDFGPKENPSGRSQFFKGDPVRNNNGKNNTASKPYGRNQPHQNWGSSQQATPGNRRLSLGEAMSVIEKHTSEMIALGIKGRRNQGQKKLAAPSATAARTTPIGSELKAG
ncbi:hypothetical protein U1Q18_035327 [Sarracenia purpurea var. burkii]